MSSLPDNGLDRVRLRKRSTSNNTSYNWNDRLIKNCFVEEKENNESRLKDEILLKLDKGESVSRTLMEVESLLTNETVKKEIKIIDDKLDDKLEEIEVNKTTEEKKKKISGSCGISEMKNSFKKIIISKLTKSKMSN